MSLPNDLDPRQRPSGARKSSLRQQLTPGPQPSTAQDSPADVPGLDSRRPPAGSAASREYTARTAAAILNVYYPGASLPSDPLVVIDAITRIMEGCRRGRASEAIADIPKDVMAVIYKMHEESLAVRAEVAACPHGHLDQQSDDEAQDPDREELPPCTCPHAPIRPDRDDVQGFLDIIPKAMTLFESITAYIETNLLRIPAPKVGGSKIKAKAKGKGKEKLPSEANHSSAGPSVGSSSASLPTHPWSAGPSPADPSAGRSKPASAPSQPDSLYYYPNPTHMSIGEIKDDIKHVFYNLNPDVRGYVWFTIEVLARTLHKKFESRPEELNALHPSMTLADALAATAPAAARPRKLNANQRKARAKARRKAEAEAAGTAPSRAQNGQSVPSAPTQPEAPNPNAPPVTREYLKSLNLDADGDVFRYMIRLGNEHQTAVGRALLEMSEKARGKQRMV